MNSNSFTDLCYGHLGRKTAYTNVDRITKENVVGVINKVIPAPNYNRPAIRYPCNYYKGDQPTHYREKKMRPDINSKACENHVLETVCSSISQIHGEPIQYVSREIDEKINNVVDKLNDYMEDVHRQTRDIKLENFQSAAGTVYKVTFKGKSTDTVPFRIHIPNPLNTIAVYSARDDSDMLSTQVLKDEKDRQYYQCYSDDLYFIIRVDRVTGSGINGSGGIPIVEHPSNLDRLPGIEVVITLLDQTNKVQSNCMNGIEQFIQVLMLFGNCEIGGEKFLQMCDFGAVEVKDSGQGMQLNVKLMTAELNQQQTQVVKDSAYR